MFTCSVSFLFILLKFTVGRITESVVLKDYRTLVLFDSVYAFHADFAT